MVKSFKEYLQEETPIQDVTILPDCRDWFTKFCDAVKAMKPKVGCPTINYHVMSLMTSGISPEEAAKEFIDNPQKRPEGDPDFDLHDTADVLIPHNPVLPSQRKGAKK